MIKDDLKKLYDKQKEAVRGAALEKRNPRPETLKDIIALAPDAMLAVCPSFRYVGDEAGSWIGSHSLPLQLLTQSKLTVDLTLDELRKDRPFGIPLQSLCDLARERFLYLNLRDYDSDSEKDFAGHGEERVAAALEKILDEARGQVYIGSALRKSIFDAALLHSGYKDPYERFYDEAKAALSDAHECYAALPDASKTVRQSLFREKRPPLIAVCWHWAFLRSIMHYVPSDIVAGKDSMLGALYVKAEEAGRLAKSQPSEKRRTIAAKAFADLAVRLRIAHLNLTAPITASYGTTYNMTEDEYGESVRLELYWEEGAPRLSDDETKRFLLFMLGESGRGPVVDFSRLHRPQGDLTLRQRIDDHLFNTGSVDALIVALKSNGQRISEAGAMLEEVKTAYLAKSSIPRERLLKMVEDYRKIANSNLAVYQRALEKVWDRIIVPAAEALMGFTDPVSPWVVAVASDAIKAKIPDVVERVLLRPAHQRTIFKVHRQLNAHQA